MDDEVGKISFYEERPNAWARVSDIAARVGVKPHVGGINGIGVLGGDDQWYDLMEVVAAVLDKIDAATK